MPGFLDETTARSIRNRSSLLVVTGCARRKMRRLVALEAPSSDRHSFLADKERELRRSSSPAQKKCGRGDDLPSVYLPPIMRDGVELLLNIFSSAPFA
jgi:hypothetical protein